MPKDRRAFAEIDGDRNGKIQQGEYLDYFLQREQDKLLPTDLGKLTQVAKISNDAH